MKQSDLIVLGLAAVAAYFILQQSKAKPASNKTSGPNVRNTGIVPPDVTREIFNLGNMPFDNGWRYFSDGTSISPDGDYYKGGQLIYQAPVTA